MVLLVTPHYYRRSSCEGSWLLVDNNPMKAKLLGASNEKLLPSCDFCLKLACLRMSSHPRIVYILYIYIGTHAFHNYHLSVTTCGHY